MGLLHLPCPARAPGFGGRGPREAHVPDYPPDRAASVSGAVAAAAFTAPALATTAALAVSGATLALALTTRSTPTAHATEYAAGSPAAGAKPTSTR